MMVKPKYQRVVLKLSGEALAGEDVYKRQVYQRPKCQRGINKIK